MTNRYRNLVAVAFSAASLCAGIAAHAQDNTIGPAQLKDFQITPRERIVTQPPPPPAVEIAPPPPVTMAPTTNETEASARPAAPRSRPMQKAAPSQAAPPPSTAPVPAAPVAQAEPRPTPAPAPSSARPDVPWLYAIPAAALALLGLVLLLRLRRRRGEAEAYYEPEADIALPAQAPVQAAPAGPLTRPWLELALEAERATTTMSETIVEFELRIANTGTADARNLRIDVKMFNAGREQDKEISAFFRSAGRESTKCRLPGIAPNTTGVIKATVTMQRDDMRAVQLDNKLLFIPMIAVNALYDWGDGRVGQTSRSYVVGRELAEASEKMGAFRVDQGPRIWRTIGQRDHTLARRV